MTTFVFLGPSLARGEAQGILDAEYLPPAACGDVYAAATRSPRAIGLIDGFFEQTPAVWHKEILYALSRGIRVFGASSMGALRAAELHAFGMEGVGRIFEAYRDGTLEDDDEVAVVHGSPDEDYRPLSVAMVTIRFTLEAAETNGLISRETRLALSAAAKKTFYADRGWDGLSHQAAALGVPSSEWARLIDFVRAENRDQKSEDARALLRRIGEEERRGLAPVAPGFDFEPTEFWEELVRSRRPASPQEAVNSGPPEFARICRHVRSVVKDRDEAFRRALLLLLVEAEARRLGVEVGDKRAIESFRRARGLLTPEAAESWMAQNHVTQERLQQLARWEAMVAELLLYHRGRIDGLLSAALQLEGRFGQIVDQVQAKWKLLMNRGAENPTLADADTTLADVLDWYKERFGAIHPTIDGHARALGFESSREFLNEIVAEYIVWKEGGG